jgi:hypothetical protein
VPKQCSICVHPDRAAIDQALATRDPYRNIAERFGVSAPALSRHRKKHLTAAMDAARKAEEGQAVATALDIRAEIRGLVVKAREILEGEESKADGRLSLMAIREIRATLELLARLEGQLDTRAQVNVVNIIEHPDWITLRVEISQTLEPFPDALEALLARLEALGGGARASR